MKKYSFIMTQEPYRWGGSEPLWSSAAEYLARGGNEVCVSAKDWGEPLPQLERLRSAGCKVFYRSGEYRIPPFLRRQINRVLPPPPYRERHLRSLAAGSDLVIISQGGSFEGLDWAEAARSQGLKYVVISQAANEQWWAHDQSAEKWAASFEEACAAFFVSHANLELVRRQLVTPLRNGRVVQNPFDVSYQAQPPWPGDPVEELLLACVARLDPFQKGQDVLFRVLDQPHWRSRKVRVTLAGDAGLCARAVRKLAAEMNLSNVEFAGIVRDMEQFWAKHHALVLPSRYEGLPLSLVEAMLCGRACIVTDVGGNSELVRDGDNGFLAKAPTVELFDEAMNRAWERRRCLREMGEIAARDVRQAVSPNPTADFARELQALVDGSAS
jgi:glycosyltransferase involved in cell wall biosynthesis